MRLLLSIFVMLIFITSCGNNASYNNTPISKINKYGKYLSTQQYKFTTNVNPATFTFTQDVGAFLPPGPQIVLASSYVITNTTDLNNLLSYNLGGLTDYLKSINDLDTYTYFLFEDIQCPEYMEGFVENYANGTLTVGMNIFTLNESCPALSGVTSYSIYKALKAS